MGVVSLIVEFCSFFQIKYNHFSFVVVVVVVVVVYSYYFRPVPSLTFFPFGQGPRSCIGKYLIVVSSKYKLYKLSDRLSCITSSHFDFTIRQTASIFNNYGDLLTIFC